METAISRQYQYYHLLSGVDFPLKTQDEINDFFDLRKGHEFIKFDWKAISSGTHLDRVKYYRFFQNRIGRNTGYMISLYIRIESIMIWLQRKLKFDRTKHIPFEIYKGTNWFSITHDLAAYVVSCSKDAKRWFRWTICADEVFLHTIAMASPYKENIIDDSLRKIDWTRGKPYIFTDRDFDMLVNSEALFARKFSYETYPKIIIELEEYLRQKNKKRDS